MTKNTAEFGDLIKTSGYKLTPQRRAVLDVIFKNRDRHLSREGIFERVKEVYPAIGRATVYRTIPLLERIGLVHRIYLDDGYPRYQLVDPEEKHEHHHLICQICGEVIDIREDFLGLLEKQIFLQKGFTVTNHRVQFFGICKKCSDRLKAYTAKEGNNH